MEKFRISACFYPTTVLFIDDNRHFLNSLQLSLDESSIVPRLYSDPLTALQFFEEDYQPSPFIERCLLHPEEEQMDHRIIDIDINAIRKEIFNPLRFNEISVIVIDYAMPGLNGLDLSLLIREKDPSIQILMLTGEADYDMAITAFNEGSIDKFLRKDNTDFVLQLNAAIYELQQRYFSELSEIIINNLTMGKKHSISSWLANPAFNSLFQKIYRENHAVEYYLTDAYGSFLFLDFNGNPSWLAVKDEEGMKTAHEIASYSDSPFPKDMLDVMNSREKLLYVYEGGFCADPELARKWLYPANLIHGSAGATFYYAYISNPRAYDFPGNNIVSYKTYLDQMLLHDLT